MFELMLLLLPYFICSPYYMTEADISLLCMSTHAAEKNLEKCMPGYGGKRIVLGYTNNIWDENAYCKYCYISCWLRRCCTSLANAHSIHYICGARD